MLSGREIKQELRDLDDGKTLHTRTKVNYRTGDSLDIRSVDLFIGIESWGDPRDRNRGDLQVKKPLTHRSKSREEPLSIGVPR